MADLTRLYDFESKDGLPIEGAEVDAEFDQLLGRVNDLPTDGLADGAVTHAKVAAANKDGAAATPSLRTLGTGAAQAAAGNDARLWATKTGNVGAGSPGATIAYVPVTINGVAYRIPLAGSGD